MAPCVASEYSCRSIAKGLTARIARLLLKTCMRCCDSLPPISPRFVSFAWRYHRCVRGSSPPAPDAEPWINRELVGGISSRRARWKRQGLPSSRRNPCDHSPYSSDPGVTRQAEWTMSELPGAAPATDHDEGSTRVLISGLNRTAFDLA